jgi:hypothetical protein
MVIVFPFGGIHKGGLPSSQPQDTSPDMQNVRPFYQGRLRGGQRPGLVKWGAGTRIGAASQPVVAMCSVSYVESP